jgi:hypothetical protein
MKLLKGERLFFGSKIDSKMREALAQARPGDRKYFEDPSSDEFLKVLAFEDERWIGKVVTGGITCADVEDIQRNVVSILRRIAPNVRASPTSLKIFAVAADAVAVPVSLDDIPVTDEEPEKDGGPYIDYP